MKKSVEADFAENTRLFCYLSCKLQKNHNFPYLCYLLHDIRRYYLKNVYSWLIYNHRENVDILGEVRAICSIVINKLMEKIFFSIYSSLKVLFVTFFLRSRLESMFYYNPYPEYNFSYCYKQISRTNSMNRRRWIHKIPFFLSDHQFPLRKWCFD